MVWEAFWRTGVDAVWETSGSGTEQREGERGWEETGDECYGGRGLYGAVTGEDYVWSSVRTARSACTPDGPAAARRWAPSRSTAD